MARIRQVGSNRWVAEQWIYRTQEFARNPKYSMYFRNRVVYSYGAHYPVAAFVGGGTYLNDAIFLNTEKASPSTNQHIGAVLKAIRRNSSFDQKTGALISGYQIFHAPLCRIATPYENSIQQILESYQKEIDLRALRLKRARKYRYWKYGALMRSLREANECAEFYGIKDFDPGPRSISKDQVELYRVAIVLEEGGSANLDATYSPLHSYYY